MNPFLHSYEILTARNLSSAGPSNFRNALDNRRIMYHWGCRCDPERIALSCRCDGHFLLEQKTGHIERWSVPEQRGSTEWGDLRSKLNVYSYHWLSVLEGIRPTNSTSRYSKGGFGCRGDILMLWLVNGAIDGIVLNDQDYVVVQFGTGWELWDCSALTNDRSSSGGLLESHCWIRLKKCKGRE